MIGAAAPSALASDASVYLVEKSRWYVQKDANSLEPASSSPGVFGDAVQGPYEFFSFVTLSSPGSVVGASVTLPNGSSTPPMVPRGLNTLVYWRDFSSQSELDAAYPNGSYKVSMTTARDGAKTPALSLTGDAYPNPPKFLNYGAAQSILASSDFTLSWQPFAGATADDVVTLRVFDSQDRLVYSTPPGGPGALPSSATSAAIPAFTLRSGEDYRAELLFFKVSQFNFAEYPGAIGIAEYDSVTTMGMHATGAPDGLVYLVEKSRWYVQKDANSLEPASSSPGIFGDRIQGPFEFFSFVTMNKPGSILGASVILPTGSATSPMVPRGSTTLIHWGDFASQSAMDAAYPNGAYKVSMTTAHDGLRAPTLLLAGDTYPNRPKFSNFAAAQSILATANFTLAWEPFVGATPDDVVTFRIFDSQDQLVYSTPSGGPDTLPFTSTSAVIPANTLAPGANYRVELLFFKVSQFNFTEYPGVFGIAEYDSVTTMNLRTVPLLAASAAPAAGSFLLRATGSGGKQYEVQASATLAPGSWLGVKTVVAPTDVFEVAVPAPAEIPRRFFRLVEK